MTTLLDIFASLHPLLQLLIAVFSIVCVISASVILGAVMSNRKNDGWD